MSLLLLFRGSGATPGPVPGAVSPAPRAKIIALFAQPFDESIQIDLDGLPMPCGDIGWPIDERFTLSGNTTAVYAATEGFTSKPSHTPSDEYFGKHLAEPFNFGVELFSDTEPAGQGKAGAGLLVLADPGGALDSWLDYGWDGRAIDLWRGERGTDPLSWERIASLTAAELTHDLRGKTIRLRDLQYRLYATAFPALSYGGTGGADGDATLAGRFKPCSFGRVFNVEPVLIASGVLCYQWHFRAVQSLDAARDGGSALSFDADYADYAALAAATIAAGFYATCNALGLIRLQTAPTFGLRVDGKGDKLDGIYVETRGGIARRLATTVGALTLSDPGNLDTASFTALDLAQPAPVGFHVNTDSGSVGAVLDAWMAGCAGWWTVTLAGLMKVGVLEVPAATADIVLATTPDLAGEPIMEAAPPPRRVTRIGWQRNWAPQDVGSLAGAMTAAEQRLYSEPWRFAESADDSLVARHPAARTVFVEGHYALQADAEAEALRQRTLFGTPRRRWRIPVWVDPFTEMVGETIEITGMNRLGWGSSKKGRCIGIEGSASAEKTSIILWE